MSQTRKKSPEVGARFESWTVVEEYNSSIRKGYILCECSCANKTRRYVNIGNLRKGFSSSCKKCLIREAGRVCNKCNKEKGWDQFYAQSSERNKGTCKECYSLAHKLKAYNITKDQYILLVDAQDNKCFLCDLPAEEAPKGLSIDHDHRCCAGSESCGKCVRGLLCLLCNSMVGHIERSPELFASEYIKNYIDNFPLQGILGSWMNYNFS